jgi:hypothetical protein
VKDRTSRGQRHGQRSAAPARPAPDHPRPVDVLPALSGDEESDRLLLDSVQRHAGNAAAASLVAADARSAPAGAGHAHAVQRSPASPPKAGAVIDGTAVETYADLDRWYAARVARLQGQREDLLSGGLPSPVAVQKAIASGQAAAAACREDPSGPLDGIRAIGAQAWFDGDFQRANNEAEAARGRATAHRLAELHGALSRADRTISCDVVDRLRDAQQSAFMASNDSALLSIADTIATALDTALTLKDGIVQAAKTQKELVYIVNYALMHQGHAPPLNTHAWVGKVASALEVADKAWAGIQLVRAGLELAGGAKTASAEAQSGVKAMGTVITAGGTLLGVSAGMTVYANFYIGPAVDACLNALKGLENVARKINRTNLEAGLYDAVNWNLEPGGREMFDFMRVVMRADGPGGVPSPIPATVASYVVDQSESLAAGSKSEEIQTTGYLFWKKLDQKSAPSWIYRNRANLWGMFYGSLPIPA